MNPHVIQILATGLTISQLFTRPVADFRSHFDEKADVAQVKSLLHDGCGLVLSTVKADQIDIPMLWDKILNPRKIEVDETEVTSASSNPNVGFADQQFNEKIQKMDPATLHAAYQVLCEGQNVDDSAVKYDEVIRHFNEVMAKLPDVSFLKTYRFPEASVVQDNSGQRFTELFEDGNRRRFIPLDLMSKWVPLAFVAAEDKNFYTHNGLDIRSIVRAFMTGLTGADGKRAPGGSTITQQTIKNMALNDDYNLDRKALEMVSAARLEKMMSKRDILQLYFNRIFLGRGTYGIEQAAQTYFGKSAQDLTLSEAAQLAASNKGPNKYNWDIEDRRPMIEQGRLHVLDRLAIDHPELKIEIEKARQEKPEVIAFEQPRRKAAFYFQDAIKRQAATLGFTNLTQSRYVVRSTMDRELQALAEKSLRAQLLRYEAEAKRIAFDGAFASLKNVIEKNPKKNWTQLTEYMRSGLYDLDWDVAVVLEPLANKKLKVGFKDGTTAWLNYGPHNVKQLKTWDMVYARVTRKAKSKDDVGQAELLIPPHVQGAVFVLEAKTGRVLAMSGGFSYGASVYNRAVTMERQPGSTIKPMIYLYALNNGFQPNTMIPNIPMKVSIDGREPWAPKNYDEDQGGMMTMRNGLEQSVNRVATNMLEQVKATPKEGLTEICKLSVAFGIYADCANESLTFSVGSKETSLAKLATAYAAIDNLGLKPPTPYFIETISDGTRDVWRRPFAKLDQITEVDTVSFYQLRSMLEGVISDGTASVFLKDLKGKVAGKTGTTNGSNDAWFVGFTPDVVVVSWIGYDNDKGKQRTLGRGWTGTKGALPIAEPILRELVRRNPVEFTMPQSIRNMVQITPIDGDHGFLKADGDFQEVLRVDASTGQPFNTRDWVLEKLPHAPGQKAAAPPVVRAQSDGDDFISGDAAPAAPAQSVVEPKDAYQPGFESPEENPNRRPRQVDELLPNVNEDEF